MHLKTLGKLELYDGEREVKLGKNELILLTHLVLDGPATRSELAGKLWHTKVDYLAQDEKSSLADANLKSTLSRLRTALREVGGDPFETSARSTTLEVEGVKIRCDYAEVFRLREQPTPETRSLIEHAFTQEFMAGIEHDNRLDVRGEPEHPLFEWIVQKREALKRAIDEAFAGERLRSALETQSLNSLLAQSPSSAELNDLYVLCQSGDYPHGERQRRKDVDSLFTYFGELYSLEEGEEPTAQLLLGLMALAGGKLSSIYLDDALGTYNQLRGHEDQKLVHVWSLLEELEDDGWFIEKGTLQLKHSAIVRGWLEYNGRLAGALLSALLKVVPADERELRAELYRAPLELIKQLSKTATSLLLSAAEEHLKQGSPQRAAELINYGLASVTDDQLIGQLTLLLAYAYERAGEFEASLQTLERVPNTLPDLDLHPSLPAKAEDVKMLRFYNLFRTGALTDEQVAALKEPPEPPDLSWAEAKRFNLLGNYHMHSHMHGVSDAAESPAAVAYFTYAEMLWDNLGCADNAVDEITNEAIAYAFNKQFDKAEACFEKAISRGQALEVSALTNLKAKFNYANVKLNQGKAERALELFGECYEIDGANEHRIFLMRVAFNQGVAYELHLKDGEAAQRFYETARDLAAELGNQPMRSRAITSLGLVKKQKFLVDSGIEMIRQSGDVSDLHEYIEARNEVWPEAK